MVPLIVLLLILVVFGGVGAAVHLLWIIGAVLLILWVLGFMMRGAEGIGGRRRWYRW